MFCKKFETLEDAQNTYPVKECASCDCNIFESGINECSKIRDEILSKIGKEGESNGYLEM